ncbi:MAG: sigma-54-dependent Fis family transcriptional regulator [Desulfobacterales bacterium]|nr:sigma-54-dependent Fis family transcriptional regulator [Desulfobacterales bacterium]
MNLPSVLVIDDQYVLDQAERQTFIDHASVIDTEQCDGIHDSALAEAVFCSGQRRDGDVITNDYEVIHTAVAGETGNGSDWALVLLDVRFDSGQVDEVGLPKGQPEDDHFGEGVRKRLALDFPDLLLVMLSGKKQQELRDLDTPYLSKTGLTPREFALCLLCYGRLSVDQRRALLGLHDNIATYSPHTLEVFREALAIADSAMPVLIMGETGTGKEVLARYIHESSSRNDKPFVAVNVAAIPSELVESELFGHEKGAFTDAKQERPGRFLQASDGTLFLDEIGDMPVATQAKVLRVLQNGEVLPVGGKNTLSVDVRVIAATSRDLAAMQKAGAFREDLTRRISSATLIIPPLSERTEDIAPIARMFLEKYSRQSGKEGITFAEEAIAALKNHPYQGNVGELENIVQWLVSRKGTHSVISARDVKEALAGSFVSSAAATREKNDTPPFNSSEAEGLAWLIEMIESFPVAKDDPLLHGGKPKIEKAIHVLLQRMAGAALERFRDARNGNLNRQAAMQFLTGDETLKGKGPGRVINEIMKRKAEHRITEEDLLRLMEKWKENS